MFKFNRQKKIILHIGTNKTGTSSIQSFLFKNKEALREKNILYTDKFIFNHAHHNIAKLFKGASPKELNIQSNWLKILEKEMYSYETIILSSELFHTIQDLSLLQNFLKSYDVTVILYIRDHLTYLASWYQQAVQLRNITCKFDEFVKLDYTRLDYNHLINRWKNAFGSTAVKVRVFDRSKLINNDIIDDFISHANIKKIIKNNYKFTNNPSISGNLLYFKILCNSLITEHQNYQYAYEISRMSEIDSSFIGKLNVNKTLVDEINTIYRKDRFFILKNHLIRLKKVKELSNEYGSPNIITLKNDFMKIMDFGTKNNFEIIKLAKKAFFFK